MAFSWDLGACGRLQTPASQMKTNRSLIRPKRSVQQTWLQPFNPLYSDHSHIYILLHSVTFGNQVHQSLCVYSRAVPIVTQLCQGNSVAYSEPGSDGGGLEGRIWVLKPNNWSQMYRPVDLSFASQIEALFISKKAERGHTSECVFETSCLASLRSHWRKLRLVGLVQSENVGLTSSVDMHWGKSGFIIITLLLDWSRIVN